MRMALIILVVLLSGCATQKWASSNGKPEQEFYADDSYCKAISQQYYAGGGFIPPGQITNRHRYENCMRGKGWDKK